MRLDTFLIDLDDTLYPPSSGLWGLIRDRINLYMDDRMRIPRAEIPALREKMYRAYGTTMRGLQATYQIDPYDYLAFVHDVPVDRYLKPDPALRQVLRAYPQRKLIFTNADRRHAQRVLQALELSDCFDGVIDIMDIDPYCKPQAGAYQAALRIAGVADAQTCLLADDSPGNLAPAQALGMATLLVNPLPIPAPLFPQIASLHDLPSVIPAAITRTSGQ